MTDGSLPYLIAALAALQLVVSVATLLALVFLVCPALVRGLEARAERPPVRRPGVDR